MKISILFNNGAKFISNEFAAKDQRSMIDQICKLIEVTNKPESVEIEKQFATGKTKYKFPLHRGFRLAVLDGNESFVVLDINRGHYLFRGKSFLNDLFPAFLERKLNEARKGYGGCLNTDQWNISGALEQGLNADRAAAEMKKLAAAE